MSEFQDYDFSQFSSIDVDNWKKIQIAFNGAELDNFSNTVFDTVYDTCGEYTTSDTVSKSSDNVSKSSLHVSSNCMTTCTCGELLTKDTTKYICKQCGLVKEYESVDSEYEDIQKEPSTTGRLRVVGQCANYFQSDLYRSNSGITPAMQTTQILDEFIIARDRYIESGGKAFPKSACKTAAGMYNTIQQHYVKRNQNKKVIMAECLHRACIQDNFVPPKATIAGLMGLKTKGIAKGNNFLRAFVADGKIDIDMNTSTVIPEIETLFMQLNYTDPDRENNHEYKFLKDAIEKIVQTAERESIGTKSIIRSKVAGATFEVLRRCKDKNLISKVLTIQEFCFDIIRKNTIERFVKELYQYHPTFEPIYAEFGLETKLSL